MSDTNADANTDGDALRTPIVAVLGHVDHGKTTLLDRIRGSAVQEGEAGAITQHIGATAVPLETVSEMAGALVDPSDFDLPGLLFIDTPGHHSFSTLRARGGALADIAVLVVDVNDGFQPQTEEAIDILRRTGTPFVVAANKIDTTPGWNPQEDVPIQQSLEAQSDRAESRLNENLYELVGDLSDAGFSADFYWRVQDFQKNVGVVPLSAMTGEGVPDLLTVLMGLSQRYLKGEMAVDATGPGKGTVLEVKEERGFGATLDVVLYDGVIRIGETIVVGGQNEPIVTEVRALLQPRPNAEIRAEKRFETVEEVAAAAGVKIAAPDLDEAMAGAPVRVVRDRDVDEVVAEVREELAEIEVETAEDGVVVKADTLGSLEAMANALAEAEIPILRAEVGDVAPRDVAVAETANEEKYRVILGFNVDTLSNAERELESSEVRLFSDDVIYQLVEEYEEHVAELERAQQETVLDRIVRPARFRILQDHTFRQNDPAVVGVEVVSGTLQNNRNVAKFDGNEPTRVGQLSGIQHQGDDVDEARAGERVSVAIDGPTVGRQIEEGDELWIELPEKHAKILEHELSEDIPADELETLNAYLNTRRKSDPFWGK
ncbi:translation initiation factor IF-2 [Halorarum salinum]|uniref:Probable translation initiation factor IF-2 n=1 Tax=Halorarum salinum TaxID=2743089 RepID=A0A7D5QC33_9EURY|nr:translation initiation factor IF-2 [Halobaculum salinum]QLG61301.1 translation initiation factor IF-2 [Halobaculum salinum]